MFVRSAMLPLLTLIFVSMNVIVSVGQMTVASDTSSTPHPTATQSDTLPGDGASVDIMGKSRRMSGVADGSARAGMSSMTSMGASVVHSAGAGGVSMPASPPTLMPTISVTLATHDTSTGSSVPTSLVAVSTAVTTTVRSTPATSQDSTIVMSTIVTQSRFSTSYSTLHSTASNTASVTTSVESTTATASGTTTQVRDASTTRSTTEQASILESVLAEDGGMSTGTGSYTILTVTIIALILSCGLLILVVVVLVHRRRHKNVRPMRPISFVSNINTVPSNINTVPLVFNRFEERCICSHETEIEENIPGDDHDSNAESHSFSEYADPYLEGFKQVSVATALEDLHYTTLVSSTLRPTPDSNYTVSQAQEAQGGWITKVVPKGFGCTVTEKPSYPDQWLDPNPQIIYVNRWNRI